MSEPNSIDPPDEPGADVSHKTLFVLERMDTLAHIVVGVFFLILSGSVLIVAAMMFTHELRGIINHPYADIKEFMHICLDVLSNLLFAVIILELLRTIITYLQGHDTQAIMREFLIVGIISSIRKILMVGAESSLSTKVEVSKSIGESAFVQESIGVVISVVAILLMIGGLILLKRYYGPTEIANQRTSEKSS